MRKRALDAGELARALARTDAEVLRAAIQQWHRYYVFAFDGGDRPKPRRDIPADLLAPEFEYFSHPQKLAHEHIMACMMIALAEINDEKFITFWAWGDFWNMLHDADDTMLTRIEDEARRTPRFRWMLSLVEVHGAPPHVQAVVERASLGVADNGQMPPAPWA